MSIVYLCPATQVPVGGVKVIYRHAELLRRLGVACEVCHPQDPAFVCRWFVHRASIRRDHSFDARTDLVVIPEIWAAPFSASCLAADVRYAIFVQNGHRLAQGAGGRGEAGLRLAYESASLVPCISQDSARLVRQAFPGVAEHRLIRVLPEIGAAFHMPGSPVRDRLVTYMPRKMPRHAAAIAARLAEVLPPGWSVQAIDGVDEAAVAAVLQRSAVFLSFADREGLALPPLEAALCGNLVVGYTGGGAREYFERPLFREVAPRDHDGFVSAASEAARELEQRGMQHPAGALAQAGQLEARYGSAALEWNLRGLGERMVAALR